MFVNVRNKFVRLALNKYLKFSFSLFFSFFNLEVFKSRLQKSKKKYTENS
jgi:hypothetical protein